MCLPLLFICLSGWGACGPVPGWLVSHFLAFLPFPFICLSLLFICLPGWVLVARFPGGLSPTSLHLSSTFSPNSLLLGVLNSFLRRVRPLCHCWCPPISTGHVTFLFIRLPGLSLLVSRPFPLAMQHFFSFVSQVCHCLWSAHSRAGLSSHFLSFVSQVCHCWPGHIPIHLSPRSVTCGVHPLSRWGCFIVICHLSPRSVQC